LGIPAAIDTAEGLGGEASNLPRHMRSAGRELPIRHLKGLTLKIKALRG
jgi:hypothetical protein